MDSRYKFQRKRKRPDGKEVYTTTIYPNIPLRDDDLYIATETGDRLDTLANQFYNDPNLWWIIATANNIHSAVFGFSDGTILRIPQNFIQIQSNLIDSQ